MLPTYFSVFARSKNEFRLKRFSDLKGLRVGYKSGARPTSSMQVLQAYSWPGDIRELMHVIEGSLITFQGNKLHFDLPKTTSFASGNLKTLEEMEREYILSILQAKHWKIGGDDSQHPAFPHEKTRQSKTLMLWWAYDMPRELRYFPTKPGHLYLI